MDRMKLAKYKRYALIARRNALNPPGLWEMFAIVNGKLVKVDPSRADLRSSPFIEITQEMPIEEARRQFAYSDWLISKAEEISGAAAFRREYLGEWDVPKYSAPPATREQAAEGIKRSFDKIALDLGRDNLRFHGSRGGGKTEAMRRLTAAQPSQSTDPTAPAAHTLPAAPPETV